MVYDVPEYYPPDIVLNDVLISWESLGTCNV
jgi:hypothetical protein